MISTKTHNRLVINRMADLFKPGTWGSAFRDQMNLLNEMIGEIESGKYETWKQVSEKLEERVEAIGRKWAEDHRHPEIEARHRQLPADGGSIDVKE